MLSPAQPAQPSQLSGKKMHHFELLFSSKMPIEREIILFQNRKDKSIFEPKILCERIKMLVCLDLFFPFSHCLFTAELAPIYIAKERSDRIENSPISSSSKMLKNRI